MSSPLRITVWGEFRHEKKNPKVAELYPQGMHETIAGFLRQAEGVRGAGAAAVGVDVGAFMRSARSGNGSKQVSEV